MIRQAPCEMRSFLVQKATGQSALVIRRFHTRVAGILHGDHLPAQLVIGCITRDRIPNLCYSDSCVYRPTSSIRPSSNGDLCTASKGFANDQKPRLQPPLTEVSAGHIESSLVTPVPYSRGQRFIETFVGLNGRVVWKWCGGSIGQLVRGVQRT